MLFTSVTSVAENMRIICTLKIACIFTQTRPLVKLTLINQVLVIFLEDLFFSRMYVILSSKADLKRYNLRIG